MLPHYVKKLSVLSTQYKQACFEPCTPLVNGCIGDVLLNAAVQNVYQPGRYRKIFQ